ncbi:MAG: ABC transporter substrate-binding protein [Clostridia bacterium]|nr:ABC transporter substrate-binding protein [Clostridia bacterium]
MGKSYWARLSFVFLTAVLALTFAGCTGRGQPPPEKVKVRLSEVVHSVFYAPQYVALHKGFFAQEGLEIELSTVWGGDKAMTALVSGNADIGLTGPETTIYVRQQGSPNKVYSFAQLTKRDGSFLLARKPMPEFKWTDLKGKTVIGGRKGGVPQMVNEYILKQNKLLPQRDLTIIQNIQFTATAGAFKSGTGDFIQLFEPTASLLEKEGAGYIVASFGTAGGEVPFTGFMATEKYIQDNPGSVQKFTNAIYRAQLWVAGHTPEEITEAIAPSFPDLDRQVLLTAVKRYKAQDTWMTDPMPKTQAFEHLQEIMKTAGELKEKVPVEQLVVRQFAQKAIETVKPEPEQPKK